MAPFFPSSFSCRRRRCESAEHLQSQPSPTKPCAASSSNIFTTLLPSIPPPSRFSSSLSFTTDIFLDPGCWSVTVTVPCPFLPPALSCPVLSCLVLSSPAWPGLPCLACPLPCKCNHVHPIPWFEVVSFYCFLLPIPPVHLSSSAYHGSGMSSAVASHSLQGHAHHSISDLGISGIMNGPNSSCPAPLPSLPCLPHGMACASARAR